MLAGARFYHNQAQWCSENISDSCNVASVHERSRHLHCHTMEGITATLVSLFSDAYLQQCSGLLSLRFYCYGIIVLYISEIPLLFSLLIQYWLDYQAAVVKGKIQRASKVRSWVNSWDNGNNCSPCFSSALCAYRRRCQHTYVHAWWLCPKRVRTAGSELPFFWENGGNRLGDASCFSPFLADQLWAPESELK